MLLIRKNLLPKDYDKNKVAETYPYKFEIVSADRVDSAVINQNARYVYALVIPTLTAENAATR